jgi:hypothetical protein
MQQRNIRSDGRFAKAIDQIALNCGDEAKQLLLGKKPLLTRTEVLALAQKPADQQLRALREATQAAANLPGQGRSIAEPEPALEKESTAEIQKAVSSEPIAAVAEGPGLEGPALPNTGEQSGQIVLSRTASAEAIAQCLVTQLGPTRAMEIAKELMGFGEAAIAEQFAGPAKPSRRRGQTKGVADAVN